VAERPVTTAAACFSVIRTRFPLFGIMLWGYFVSLDRRSAMPAIDEDDRPKKKIVHEIGQELALISVKELEERIVLLKEEIGRLEADIQKKQASRSVADQFFKK
jgi:uncharacterized small protein (DUF1192 family)